VDSCKEGYSAYSRKCYKCVTDKLTHRDAAAYCDKDNARLARLFCFFISLIFL
jgi:hypothetical protein